MQSNLDQKYINLDSRNVKVTAQEISKVASKTARSFPKKNAHIPSDISKTKVSFKKNFLTQIMIQSKRVLFLLFPQIFVQYFPRSLNISEWIAEIQTSTPILPVD